MVYLNQHNRETYMQKVIHSLNARNEESFRELYLAFHPTDQAELLGALDSQQRQLAYQYLTPAEFADIFQGLALEQQSQYFAELQEDYAIAMIQNLYTDDAADFLAGLPEHTKSWYLSKINPDDAQHIQHLLQYPSQTAGAIMAKEFVSVATSSTVAEVLEHLRNHSPDAETIYYLYAIDEHRQLAGVVSLRNLIVAPLEETIEHVMSTRVISEDAHTDQEKVAQTIKKYDLLALPITDQGKLVGIVTVDDVMDVVEEETEEDFGEISATRGTLNANVSSFKAARKRAPWIIMLMFLGLITAEVIGQFEETLEAVILLAVFIPLIMDSAGNTGTQALAVVVRGLALGTVDRSSLGKMIKREFATGILLGIMCALTLLVVVPLFYPEGGYWLALIVASSILLTLCLATIVGAVVPILINKLKIDPAVASGPFITTINDIAGLFIYFSIATALLQYLP